MGASNVRKKSPLSADRGAAVAHRRTSSAYDDVLIMTIGLSALCDEMAAQGFDRANLLEPIGLTSAALDDPESVITYRQKVTFFQNIHALTRDPCIGLRAGQRHRVQDLGIYGYALSSCATLGEALRFGLSHSRLAGSILERSLRVDRDVAVIEAHDIFGLHEVLPLAAEFAFSTMHRLTTLVMQHPPKISRLKFPYPAPRHAGLYADLFRCCVEFDADVLELHLEAETLAEPCPNASLLSERMCRSICARFMRSMEADEPAIVRELRAKLFKAVSSGNSPALSDLASQLNISTRTLARRLSLIGVKFQDLIDDVRSRLAKELLGNTGLSVENVAERLGFSDASNFSKAFKRWASKTPAEYRKCVSWRDKLTGSFESS